MRNGNDHDMMNQKPKKMPEMAQMMQDMAQMMPQMMMPGMQPMMMPEMAQMMPQMMMPGMQPMMMPEMAQMMPQMMMPGCMPMHCMPMYEHMPCMPMHEHMHHHTPCHPMPNPCGCMMPEMVAGEYAEMEYADHEEVEPEDVDYLEDLNKAYPELSKECKECLKQLMAIDFALVELNLYLDTHPMDRRAIAEHNRYLCMRKPLVKRIEECYGPLIHKTEAGYPWAWLNQPWPWRIEF